MTKNTRERVRQRHEAAGDVKAFLRVCAGVRLGDTIIVPMGHTFIASVPDGNSSKEIGEFATVQAAKTSLGNRLGPVPENIEDMSSTLCDSCMGKYRQQV